GEMLREGWVIEDDKRREYYRRIVRETHRLENMVERVLEKSRLSTAEATPEPGDVNALVEGLGPALIGEGTEHAARDVVFELRDRGPGIPANERSRIFEAFYRVGNERTRTTKGTGLGLHLAALHCEV